MRHKIKATVTRHDKLVRQFIKFGIVGFIGFLVDAGVLRFCMSLLSMGPYSGRVVSFIVAATSTWACNRFFTFRGQSRHKAHVEWARFMGVCMGGFVFNYGAYALLIATVPLVATYPVIGVAAGSIAGMFFNFFGAKKAVFK